MRQLQAVVQWMIAHADSYCQGVRRGRGQCKGGLPEVRNLGKKIDKSIAAYCSPVTNVLILSPTFIYS